jgi:hypothetical protein
MNQYELLIRNEDKKLVCTHFADYLKQNVLKPVRATI